MNFTVAFAYLVMFGLGYWAAHIRLTSLRVQALRQLESAKDILAVTEAVVQAERATPTDRSKVSEDDKHTAV